MTLPPDGRALQLANLHEVPSYMDPVVEHESLAWRRFVCKLFRSGVVSFFVNLRVRMIIGAAVRKGFVRKPPLTILGSIQSWSHLDLTGNAGRPVEGKLSSRPRKTFNTFSTIPSSHCWRHSGTSSRFPPSRDRFREFVDCADLPVCHCPSLSRAQERGPNPIGDDTQPVTNQRGLDAKGLGQK